jgi:pimeloyl-ACP methyl ester carboxylesterase
MSDTNVTIARLAASSQRIETAQDGCPIIWHIWGNGPPLVLLHGASGSWTHWIRNIEALAKHRQLLVPDLPGNGESGLPETCDHMTFQSLLAAGIRELTGAHLPVDIAGFSLGGLVGAHLAAWSPELVRRLILVDTGGLSPPIAPVARNPQQTTENSDKRAIARERLLDYMLHSPDSVDDLALDLLGTSAKQCRIDIMTLAGFIIPDRLAAILPDVTCQVDAIWGAHDRLLPDPAAQLGALRRFKPDADMRVIPQASHWVMYEAATAFNEALTDMLNAELRT